MILWVFQVLCLLSGITGLIYETLWIRILSLGVGSTSASMSLVLSIFFLGLSLGSFLSGRYLSKIQKPILAYAVVEGILGLYSSLAILPLFRLQEIVGTLPLVGNWAWLGLILKYGLVLLLLLVPTVCMGTTLPLLTKIFVSANSQIGRRVSHFYALNTLGAVLGAMLTGFVLIPSLGIFLSNYLSVGINLVIAAVAFWLHKQAGSEYTSPVVPTNVAEKTTSGLKEVFLSDPVVLLATGMSGFISIACEVVWNKYLGVFFGTNIYGLGLTLSVYLLGIALGSWALAFVVDRIRDLRGLFVQIFLLSSIAILFSSFQLNRAPLTSHVLYQLFQGSLTLLSAKAIMAGVILFVPTLLFGALFPLAIAIIARSFTNAPKVVGVAYGVNTLGAILGSYLSGIVLLPSIGSSYTLQLAALLSLLTAGALLWKTEWTRARKGTYVALASGLAALTLTTGFFQFETIISGAYHSSGQVKEGLSHGAILKRFFKTPSTSGEEFKLVIEGETAVISLSHDPSDGENYRRYMRLKTNGLNESVYNLDNLEELPKYEALIGLLPYVFSRNPETAFIVGYGGGFTADFLSRTDLKRVNVVELEEGILKAANFVHNNNNPILKRPNVKLQIEDARFMLASGQLGKQDIIVSQPSHSWLSGAANLFTKEFFTIVQGNLSEKGIFAQWLNLYNMDVPVLQSLLKTFFTVFPHGAVFTQAGDSELVLLGSNRPLDLNLQKLDALAKDSVLRAKLTQVFRDSPYDLLSMYSISRKDVLDLTEEAAINTDVNAFAETVQSSIFYEGLGTRQTPQAYLSAVFRGDYHSIVKVSQGLDAQFYYQMLMSLHGSGQSDKLPIVLSKYEEVVKTDTSAHWNLGYLCLQARRYYSAISYLEKAFQHSPKTEILTLMLAGLTQMERYSDVIQYADRYPNLRDKAIECYLGNALVLKQDLKRAKGLFSKFEKNIEGYTGACGGFFNRVMGSYYLAKHEPAIAVPFLEAYYKENMQDVLTVQQMVEAYRELKDKNNENQFVPYLNELVRAEVGELNGLRKTLEGMGHTQDATVLAARSAKLTSAIVVE
jgi:spermidine synthase